ncbi:septation protein SepH [Actinotalea sp. Marseille-Q4924]|uniref:septation protein SepH n=1 Tax=Actinotalea sp. Marseille-Q4924 TaxID=2866571 RepID=UPI001CE4999E|nr:septation protein SepH [Actinotalea sp. Marseille-Q4924]
MGELTLVGLHEDGEHVLLESPDGRRFRLPIDDALRAAVRRDRAQLEQARAELSGSLPPREIQARIRAGARAEDVAADAGMPVELVRRYEGPVLAEREFVVGQARATRIGHDPGAPVLGDLVTDRLATRGVGAADLAWDAFRPSNGRWTVEVSFSVGGSPRSACWTFDGSARTVRAEDDEARWLSETDLGDAPIPRRHLAAVRASGEVDVDAALRPLLASVDLSPAAPEPEPEDPMHATAALLDDLTDRRGVRQQVEVTDDEDDDEAFEGFGPQHAFDFDNPDLTVPAAHPPHSRPDLAVDARVLPMPTGSRPAGDGPGGSTGEDATDEPATPDAEETSDVPPGRGDRATATSSEAGGDRGPAPRAPGAARPRSKRGRASVPSWDEIVFGAKSD